ncbi:MAG: hypothetical protein PS018_11620 [bacterium]|nr:hypothetical protein [bacterium]
MGYSSNQALFSARTTDGNSSAVDWVGGRGVFAVFGTFNGATVKLQWSPDDGTTWLDVDRLGDTYVTLSAAGSGGFELPPCKLRANLASAGGSTSLTAVVSGVNI